MEQATHTADKKALPSRGAGSKAALSELVPLFGLVAVVAAFAIVTKGTSVSVFNLKILLNQVVILAVIATGSSFIFSMGNFDISLGACTCLAAVVGALVRNAHGHAAVVILACLATAICISMANAACIALFRLPSFIVTLAMLMIINAAVSLIVGSMSVVTLAPDLGSFDTTAVKLAVLVVVIVLALAMFSFHRLGRSNKIVGGSPTVARYSGISILRNTLLSFLVSGIGIGLGAFVLLARTGSVSPATGSGLGFDIIIAIVLGGMPISGGARSRITAAIVGAFTITALNNGLTVMGASPGVLQLVRGLLFVTVVGLMALRNRQRLLVR